MDIGEISKVAKRKMINIDAAKLREKISRETTKIIKLKVAQDTAYWDLKEKLHQVEGNHERLQQTMVEVQMQYETISGQYQDELRLRPETLNKLSSTREICDVLEDYSERLKQTLSRCKGDQEALCEAYQKSGQLVKDITTTQMQNDERNLQKIVNLEEKVKTSGEHQRQLMQVFTAFKQQLETEVKTTKEKLAAVNTQNEELKTTLNEINKKHDMAKCELVKKEDFLCNLQREVKQMLQELSSQNNELQSALLNKDKELQKVLEANSALKTALSNQEQLTKTMSDQNGTLGEKYAELEHAHTQTQSMARDLSKQLEEASNTYENINNNMSKLIGEKQNLVDEIKRKDELISSLQTEVFRRHESLVSAEKHKLETLSELKSAQQDGINKQTNIEQLRAEAQRMNEQIQNLQNEFKSYRETTEEKFIEFGNKLENKDKELDLKTSAISQLMSDLKKSTTVCNKVSSDLDNCKKDLEAERDNAKANATKIQQLEASAKEKEEQLSKQMSVILEMRNEKDRLQDKIADMQGRIDNIRKELSGRPAPRCLEPAVQPEQDDNAVMMTPLSNKKGERTSSPILLHTKVQFALPRSEPEPKQLDDMLYNLFSESSADGDSLDVSEVNRRFSALSRGERVSPMPLSGLKRRGAVPSSQGKRVGRLRDDRDVGISLSQVKNDLNNKKRLCFKSKGRQ